jgi:HEAT repeat protein
VPALLSVESDDAKLIAALTEALSDESGRVRRPAAQALAKYGERARPAAPQIIAMLERGDNERPIALEALRAIGVRSVPDLLNALAVKDPKTRVWACESLGALGPDAKDAAGRLRELLEGQPQSVQDAARAALAKIGPPAS